MNAVIDKPIPEVSTAQSRPRRRVNLRRMLPYVLGGVVLIAAVIFGNWYIVEGRFLETTDDAYVQGDITVLSPRIDGDVLSIPVTDNQHVHTGDPLIMLDPRDWQTRLDQAQAAANEADAAVTTAARQVMQQRSTIAAAQAAVSQAQAGQVLANADAARAAELVRTGAVSRQFNDQAVAEQRKNDAGTVSAQAQLTAAEQQLQVLTAQLNQAQARQQSAAAAVRMAQDNLSYTVIRAPFDGVVGNRAAQLGEHVPAGTQLIAEAPERAQLYVLANFKETQLAHVTPGMQVDVVADIDSSHPIEGKVASLAPATGALFSLLPPENATGNFTRVVQRVPVKIMLDPGQAADAPWLRAGLSVTASVDTRGPEAKRLGYWGAAAATLHRLVP